MKKAQIQNMETITVVIIIIILIVIGIVYAANQKKDTLKDQRETNQDLKAMEIATNAINQDFMKCSTAQANLESCVDYHKIKALAQQTKKDENYLYFYRLFEDSKVNINILKSITTNQPDENITIYEVQGETRTTIPIRIPITVNNQINNHNYFAIMEVQTYR